MTWKGTIQSNADLRFGNWLRRQRLGAGISQKQAAADFGVSIATWRAWEHGFRAPRLPQAVALCHFFDIMLVQVSEWG